MLASDRDSFCSDIMHGLEDYMVEKGSGLGIVGYDCYEFVVNDIERSQRFYSKMMDVAEGARLSERESAERGEKAVLFGAGKAQFVCVTPSERGSAADRWP